MASQDWRAGFGFAARMRAVTKMQVLPHTLAQTLEPWHREHLVRTIASTQYRFHDSRITVVAQETVLERLIFPPSRSARARLHERAFSDNTGHRSLIEIQPMLCLQAIV